MPNPSLLNDMNIQTVLRNALDGVFIIDRNREYILFSKGCDRIMGQSSASLVGSRCVCHTVAECRDTQGRDLSGALCPGMQIFNGEVQACTQRMRIRHAGGRQVWVETNYSALGDGNGGVECVVGIMRDITASILREEELKAALAAARRQSAVVDVGGVSTYPEPASVAKPEKLDDMMESVERREILNSLRKSGGQRTRAARTLGISRSRLYRRMEALGINPREAI